MTCFAKIRKLRQSYKYFPKYCDEGEIHFHIMTADTSTFCIVKGLLLKISTNNDLSHKKAILSKRNYKRMKSCTYFLIFLNLCKNFPKKFPLTFK